jgi:hypothetical protein
MTSGQPTLTIWTTVLPGSKPSWMTVSLTPWVAGSISKVTLDRRSPTSARFSSRAARRLAATRGVRAPTGRTSVIGVARCPVAAVWYAAGVVGRKLALRYASAIQVTAFGCLTGTAACLSFAGQLLSQLGAPYNPRGHNLRRSVHPGTGTSALAE